MENVKCNFSIPKAAAERLDDLHDRCGIAKQKAVTAGIFHMTSLEPAARDALLSEVADWLRSLEPGSRTGPPAGSAEAIAAKAREIEDAIRAELEKQRRRRPSGRKDQRRTG